MNKILKEYFQEHFMISNTLIELYKETEYSINDYLKQIVEIAQVNQLKVLNAMQKNKLSDIHFHGTSGYGYDDIGREVIDKIYADVFEAEDALVRYNFISGTHALSTALFGLLRPGDVLLAATGKPYDTLEEVIGLSGNENNGSLKDFGINYCQVDLLSDGSIDYESLHKSIDKSVKVIIIQRSKGYNWRPSLSISDIERLIKYIKNLNHNVICMVDNCYGEFVEDKEPTQVGADICVGSLIKNPGGGIAQTGGYVVGKKQLIEKISYRLTSPGIGKECGATLGFNRSILQGLFLAPHVVGESLKGAIFAAKFMESLGFEVSPKFTENRTDIIQAIKFNDDTSLIAFCQGIQKSSPVDSHVTPYPWDMPGYQHKVIMAAGTFTQGASIELTADAPIKPPYIAYMQGGLTFEHIKIGIVIAAQEMINKGLIKLD